MSIIFLFDIRVVKVKLLFISQTLNIYNINIFIVNNMSFFDKKYYKTFIYVCICLT